MIITLTSHTWKISIKIKINSICDWNLLIILTWFPRKAISWDVCGSASFASYPRHALFRRKIPRKQWTFIILYAYTTGYQKFVNWCDEINNYKALLTTFVGNIKHKKVLFFMWKFKPSTLIINSLRNKSYILWLIKISTYNKRPMGHIAYLKKQFKSINTMIIS